MDRAPSNAAWRRSSRCEAGHCVEAARVNGGVALRNSTRPTLELAFSASAWRAFISGVSAGEFDRA